MLLPVAALTALKRFPLLETFSLRLPHWRSVLGSTLIGASAGVAIAGIALRLLPAPEPLLDEMKNLLLLKGAPLWQVWLVLAITPALCEELLFRGLFFSGLRRLGPWKAILISALLFGLTHASIYRMLPTMGLGLLLGYVVWRSRSLYCSMLMHGLNNGLIATFVLLASHARIVSRSVVRQPRLGLS
jgi:sodium transport system permease protein